MIAKVRKPGKGFGNLAQYQFKDHGDGEPTHGNELIAANVMAADPQFAAQQMEEVAAQRPDVKRPVLHVILAWHEQDNIDNSLMEDCGKHVLEEMGIDLENHQYMMVRHNDKPHPHMHVMVNRVGFNQELYLNQNSGRKAGKAAKFLNDKHGFYMNPQADLNQKMAEIGADKIDNWKDFDLFKMENRMGVRAAKHIVYENVSEALYACDGTFEDFDLRMRKSGRVAPSFSFDQEGNFYGASFTLMSSTRPGEPEYNDQGEVFSFKGSQLGKNKALRNDKILEILNSKLERREALEERKQRNGMLRKLSADLRKARQKQRGLFKIGMKLESRYKANAVRAVGAQTAKTEDPILRLFDNRRISRIVRGRRGGPKQSPRRGR